MIASKPNTVKLHILTWTRKPTMRQQCRCYLVNGVLYTNIRIERSITRETGRNWILTWLQRQNFHVQISEWMRKSLVRDFAACTQIKFWRQSCKALYWPFSLLWMPSSHPWSACWKTELSSVHVTRLCSTVFWLGRKLTVSRQYLQQECFVHPHSGILSLQIWALVIELHHYCYQFCCWLPRWNA